MFASCVRPWLPRAPEHLILCVLHSDYLCDTDSTYTWLQLTNTLHTHDAAFSSEWREWRALLNGRQDDAMLSMTWVEGLT